MTRLAERWQHGTAIVGALWLTNCAVGVDVSDESLQAAASHEQALLMPTAVGGMGPVSNLLDLPTRDPNAPPPEFPQPMAAATDTTAATSNPVTPEPAAGSGAGGTAASTAGASGIDQAQGGSSGSTPVPVPGTTPAPADTPTPMPTVMNPFGGGMPGGNTPGGNMTASTLIDDLEDGDDVIALVGGRDGSWFMFNDGSANQSFEIDTACNRMPPANVVCAHSTVNQVPEYAGLGFSLHADDSPYDASAYQGVRFYGKNAQGGSVTISIVTRASAAATGSPGFEHNVNMSGNWQQFEVRFGQLNLATWYTGAPVTFSASELVKVQFMTGAGSSHDISVDDVEFF